ncbi:glutamate 5-kinase [bacterium]|nr:glutamate 5-kinase [bacterium]
MKTRQELLGKAQRLVIKLGTGLLTDNANRLDEAKIAALADQVARLRADGREVAVVSSGAIAAGMAVLGLTRRPKQLAELQACAAIGQGKLMALYDEVFGRHGVHAGQVLLTHDDLKNRTRHLNARNTLLNLLERGIIPIINENDTVSVEEIKFGDNDRLAALAATLIDADLLVILSHVAGLLEADQVVPLVPEITPAIVRLAGGTTRVTSVGGMISKIDAARIVTRAGIAMIIASGEQPDMLDRLRSGEDLGTLFVPRTPKLASRKRWIAFFQHTAGTLVVDDGARAALCAGGKSLLAKGIVAVRGEFGPDAVISICDQKEVEIARGLAKVASNRIDAKAGVVVHRDDLVIL